MRLGDDASPFGDLGLRFDDDLETYTVLSKQLKEELEKGYCHFSATAIKDALVTSESQLYDKYSAGELDSSCISIITLHEKLLEILLYAFNHNNKTITEAILTDDLLAQSWHDNIVNIVLGLSIKYKLYDILREILALDDISWPADDLGISAINAIYDKDKDIKMAITLINSGKADINTMKVDESGVTKFTVLEYAIPHGNVDMVSSLIGKGVDYDINDQGVKSLLLAAYFGQVETVKLLLGAIDKQINLDTEMKFNLTLPSKHNLSDGWQLYTPLIMACGRGAAGVVDLLLDCVDINFMTSDLTSALIAAAAMGNENLVKKLLSNHEMDKEHNDQVLRALHRAVELKHNGVVKILMNTCTLLDGDEAHNKLISLTSLVPIEDYDDEEDTYKTTLMVAIEANNTEIVKLLLNEPYGGPHINDTNENRRTALTVAAEHGRDEIIKLLLACSHLRSHSTYHEQCQRALHVAVFHMQEPTVILLVKHGADINGIIDLSHIDDNLGGEAGTPLWLATRCGYEGMLLFLLKEFQNIDPNLHSKYESDPLIVSVISGTTAMVEGLLYHHNQRLTSESTVGAQALHLALTKPYEEGKAKVQLLLAVDKRVNPNLHIKIYTNTNKPMLISPLMFACLSKSCKGAIKKIHLLLDNGVNPAGTLLHAVSNTPCENIEYYLLILGTLLCAEGVEELTHEQVSTLPAERQCLYNTARNRRDKYKKCMFSFLQQGDSLAPGSNTKRLRVI